MPPIKDKFAVKAFHYRGKPRPPNQPAKEAEPIKDSERLEGVVQGKRASDLEERWSRALDKNPRVDGYQFIVHEITGANLPGEAQLDYLVYSGGQAYANQIDGEFAHKSAAQKANDAVQDARLSEAIGDQLSAPFPASSVPVNGLIARIPGYLLEDQDAADELAQEMYP